MIEIETALGIMHGGRVRTNRGVRYCQGNGDVPAGAAVVVVGGVIMGWRRRAGVPPRALPIKNYHFAAVIAPDNVLSTRYRYEMKYVDDGFTTVRTEDIAIPIFETGPFINTTEGTRLLLHCYNADYEYFVWIVGAQFGSSDCWIIIQCNNSVLFVGDAPFRFGRMSSDAYINANGDLIWAVSSSIDNSDLGGETSELQYYTMATMENGTATSVIDMLSRITTVYDAMNTQADSEINNLLSSAISTSITSEQLTDRGDWDKDTAYAQGDVVAYGNNVWRAVSVSTGVVPEQIYLGAWCKTVLGQTLSLLQEDTGKRYAESYLSPLSAENLWNQVALVSMRQIRNAYIHDLIYQNGVQIFDDSDVYRWSGGVSWTKTVLIGAEYEINLREEHTVEDNGIRSLYDASFESGGVVYDWVEGMSKKNFAIAAPTIPAVNTSQTAEFNTELNDVWSIKHSLAYDGGLEQKWVVLQSGETAIDEPPWNFTNMLGGMAWNAADDKIIGMRTTTWLITKESSGDPERRYDMTDIFGGSLNIVTKRFT